MQESVRIGVLRETPAAISLMLVAALATFFNWGPAVASAVSTTLAFNYIALEPRNGWAFGAEALTRTAFILLISGLIALFSLQRRTSDRRLRIAVAALKERTEALTQAQQGSKSAAWRYRTEDRRTHWYEGGAEIFGRSLEEITAMGSPTSLVLEEDRQKVADAAHLTITTGRPFHVEFRVRWPNGEIHWLEALGRPIAANPSEWRGVTTDITDRKNAELAMIRSEKLAAAGRISSTIAHEINNPLEAITNLLYLAGADPILGPQARFYLEQADSELARLATITRHTLTFVRNNHTKGPIDLSAEAESVVALFKTRCEARGGRIRCLQTPGLMVDVPSGDIRQILTNLISNASDALSGSGLIDIQMVPELSNATILVRDNGVGIPPENLERIFEPFFTTKDDTGTGIGLWITKELVEKNGGRIYAVSGNLPDGFKTSFCVEFPLYRSEPFPAADGSEPKQDRESIGSGEKDSSLSAR